jgi:tyrocidine synthetase-3
LKELGFGTDEVERVRALWTNNARLSLAHKVKGKIKGDIIFFKARNNVSRSFKNLRKWSEYTGGDFYYHYLFGDHYDAMRDPRNIKMISDELLNVSQLINEK